MMATKKHETAAGSGWREATATTIARVNRLYEGKEYGYLRRFLFLSPGRHPAEVIRFSLAAHN